MTIAQYRSNLSAFANRVLSDDEINNSIEAIESGEGDAQEIAAFDEGYAAWKANQ